MGRLSISLLGGFQARLDFGPPLILPVKAQALLAYLAIRPEQAHPRDKLAALLWGGTDDEHARGNLRRTLFDIRQVIRRVSPDPLITEAKTVALGPDALDIDVLTLERLVAEGTPAKLEQAAALYQGDLLEGLSVDEPRYEEWLIAERERLRELVLEALAQLLAHQSKSEPTEPAIQTAIRLLSLDPLQEAVHRALMRLYARQGRRGTALRQYQMCVDVFQRELGAAPEEETKRLYQEILRTRPPRVAPSAPVASRAAPSLALIRRQPFILATDTPLIGRSGETARIREALTQAVSGQGRVIAIVGEAGIGKTSVLGALAADAIALGARVLVGRCYESASILPFGPWVDAFRSGQPLEEEGVFDDLQPIWRSELARLLPEANIAGLPAPSDNQLRLFEAVAHLVEKLAARQGLVLMLEDIHWADEMSLRLLAFISRHVNGWRALVLTTAREQELTDASMARRTLEELSREPHGTSLELAPLSRADTALLVRSLVRAPIQQR